MENSIQQKDRYINDFVINEVNIIHESEADIEIESDDKSENSFGYESNGEEEDSIDDNTLLNEGDNDSQDINDSIFISELTDTITVADTNFEIRNHSDWYPFPNEQFFWLYQLCNMPRHPISTEFQKHLWFILQKLGLKNLPTISSIRKFGLRKLPTPKVTKYNEDTDQEFSMISPTDIVRREIAKPYIRKMLSFYPIDTVDSFKSIAQGSKWRTSLHYQAPMATSQGINYFVGDYVYIAKGDLDGLLSVAYVSMDPGNFSGICEYRIGRISRFYAAVVDNKTNLYVTLDAVVTSMSVIQLRQFQNLSSRLTDLILDLTKPFSVPVTQLISLVTLQNLLEPAAQLKLWNLAGFINWNGLSIFSNVAESFPFTESHPTKKLSHDCRVLVVPVILFSDETSGNRSKKWNHHESWYMKLAGLPPKEQNKLHNIHFLATSNTVGYADLAKAVVEDLNSGLSKGVECYDEEYQCKMIIIGGAICVLADTPRASNLCSQSIQCDAFCRCCTIHHGESPQNLNALKRNPLVTLQTRKYMEDMKRDRRSEKEIKSVTTSTGIVCVKNADVLFRMIGFNPHEDIPIEILHTLLLGIKKKLNFRYQIILLKKVL